MTATPSEAELAEIPFELRGDSFTLPVLRLYNIDMDKVSKELAIRVGQAPEFFRNAPVVIDLYHLKGMQQTVDFPLLVGLLRGHGMIPVGVRNGSEEQLRIASALDLAVLADQRMPRPPRPEARSAAPARPPPVARPEPKVEPPPPLPEPPPPPPSAATTPPVRSRMVSRPVRSGQRVFSPNGDLVVLASVGSGAEVLAEGNIHVYGPLRGRALAGINGDEDARIFCRGLEAELVSIAGHYRVSEDLDPSFRSKAVQIYLDGGRLRVEPV